jgi:hypothetical protein
VQKEKETPSLNASNQPCIFNVMPALPHNFSPSYPSSSHPMQNEAAQENGIIKAVTDSAKRTESSNRQHADSSNQA